MVLHVKTYKMEIIDAFVHQHSMEAAVKMHIIFVLVIHAITALLVILVRQDILVIVESATLALGKQLI